MYGRSLIITRYGGCHICILMLVLIQADNSSIRAIYFGDSPHSIGNRLIKKMTKKYTEIILKFNKLENARQPKNKRTLSKGF